MGAGLGVRATLAGRRKRPPCGHAKRYRNHFGQLLEHSPFCERDFRVPEHAPAVDREGDFPIDVRKEGMIHTATYACHPFDVVGWDGYHFLYAFSIHDFELITGRVHQPPPVHQTFETDAFVICSFCPRLYDYHPKSIPPPTTTATSTPTRCCTRRGQLHEPQRHFAR